MLASQPQSHEIVGKEWFRNESTTVLRSPRHAFGGCSDPEPGRRRSAIEHYVRVDLSDGCGKVVAWAYDAKVAYSTEDCWP